MTSLLGCVWLWCFSFGYRQSGSLAPALSRLFPPAPENPRPGAVLIAVAIVTLISLVGLTLLLLKTGGGFRDVIVGSRVERVTKGFALFTRMYEDGMYVAVAAFLYSVHLQRKAEARIPWLMRVTFVGLLLLNIGSMLYFAERGGIVFAAAVLIIGYTTIVRRLSVWQVFALVAIPVILAIGLRAGRDFVLFGRLRDAEYFSGLPRLLTVGLNLNMFDYFMLVVRDWGKLYEFRVGEDFLVGGLGIVPRSFWANKPEVIHFGTWLKEYYLGDRAGGWPVTTVGQWYANFSYGGIVLGGMVAGALYRALQYRYADFHRNPWAFVFMFAMVFDVIPGGWNAVTPMYLVLYAMPLYVVGLVLQRSSPQITTRPVLGMR